MTHNDNTDIAVKLRVAADCFGCARFVPSEAELGIELTKEALDALPADLGVQTDGVRDILADPANYNLYQLAPWLDGLANRLTQADNRTLQEIFLERPKVQPRRQRKPHKPTLASVAKQANKAALAVARYEVKPDGTVIVVTGAPEAATAEDPWPLDEFRAKEPKQ